MDTGILMRLADRREPGHAGAREIFERPELKIVPEPVIVETDYLLARRYGFAVEIAFLRSLRDGAFAIESPTMEDRSRATELIERYQDLRLGYVDGVTMAMAERLGERRIATIDRRHFTVVRPSHVDAFEIVP